VTTTTWTWRILTAARHHKVLVAVSTIAVGLVAVGGSVLQSTTYEASTRVLLEPRATDDLFSVSTTQGDPVRLTQTEIQIIMSERVAAIVRETQRLGKSPAVIVKPVGQTNVVTISVRDHRAARAAVLADAFATAYIDFRKSEAADDRIKARNQLQTQISAIQLQLDDLTTQGGIDLTFSARRASLVDQQSELARRRNQLESEAAVVSGGAQIVSPAKVPNDPIAPTPVRNVAFGIAAGLLLGLGLALGFEQMGGNSITDPEELDRAGSPFKTVAELPRSTGETLDVEQLLDDAERFDALCDWVWLLQHDQSACIIELTSPEPSAAKTATVAGLAAALADGGQRVLVIGCDPDGTRIDELLGVPSDLGLADVVFGRIEIENAIQSVDGIANLEVLAAGAWPRDSSQLLDSPRTGELIGKLEREHDVVLIDAPAQTAHARTSAWADAVVVVVTAGHSSRRSVARTVARLSDSVPSTSVGLVLHGSPIEPSASTQRSRAES
jgi:Mrp family chromosome partitioning ATPase/capsular polysaccharide biosynthesis protein